MGRELPREIDSCIGSYTHLHDFPRQDEALHILKRIASVVKPIMRARHWKVGQLCEFYPDQTNLLGLNYNRGQRILLRLRYAGDRSQFLPFEQVMDTMLHELSHIVHGPHDRVFHALWDQLREELEGLFMKGYTGEGFLSKGHKLGGQVPYSEIQRIARAEAEKRKAEREAKRKSSGHKLGGSKPPSGRSIRNIIADSVERRNRTDIGCGNESRNEEEIRQISETWQQNGFRTKAEEDAANEAAIAQALWELVQEDEKRKYGSSYVPPTAQNPYGNGGGSIVNGGEGTSNGGGYYPPQQQPAPRSRPDSYYPPPQRPNSTTYPPPQQQPPSSLSRPASTITEYYSPQPPIIGDGYLGGPAYNPPQPPRPPPIPTATRPPTSPRPPSPPPDQEAYWECQTCTYHNSLHRPQNCEMCSSPGPALDPSSTTTTNTANSSSSSRQPPQQTPPRRPQQQQQPEIIDLTSSPPVPPRHNNSKPPEPNPRRSSRNPFGNSTSSTNKRSSTSQPKPQPTWWGCSCGNRMEAQWWMCNVCGKIKDSS
ncbi:putative Fe2+/Zn2+ regulated transporter [Triangularia verruculosa]|uniref:Fe2+/Zn2+ regulated transporter n=1 Tax=Triangularia verruculosa TaxID=2587418 RepID=A0AAN6XRI1_9PEZI|nr:putative Fe2+/Zn2+ regulated transporter [Triangularia verruculosa]